MGKRGRISAMWSDPASLGDHSSHAALREALVKALDACVVAEPVVWFRADDVGVPSANLFAMLECFRRHDAPLALAVVPSWLSASRWQAVRAQTAKGGRWCFHQHGRRHVNHQSQGRKSEFGSARSLEARKTDVLLGKQRLERLLGASFFPAFTPPWNRMDTAMENVLQSLGFRAVSRNDKVFFREPLDLFEVPVNCDLHTRRGTARQAWADFYAEFQWWIAQGMLGVMLHHQRMNRHALEFLDMLLSVLCAEPRIRLAGLDELVQENIHFHPLRRHA
ncbi:polysaccharide deacetylase family protein [Desulfonatronum thioautotrophicum]|uniref:polysaccharide deacetylase family protein n=1 Tax=Desulfonatronum thioautotrophicum TaxID=617001 RepID=UPI0013793320|nr:polysaccharide deacetylase family protein [Desulfonatronum thioautotrophicum]